MCLRILRRRGTQFSVGVRSVKGESGAAAKTTAVSPKIFQWPRKFARRVKMSLPSKKTKDDANREVSDVAKDAKSFIEKILGDVSKTSATKQIVIGTTSGWATGFITMKVGKVAAFAVGGGIIMLQIAANQGYIKINWDKIQKKADKITDKVEEKLTGEGPKLMDKMERYVDKKLDKAEQLLKNGEARGRKWYQNICSSGEGESFRVKELHFFLVSFAAGVAIGMASAN